MSTARSLLAPEPPPNPAPKGNHRPRHRWGRAVGWIVGAFLFLLALMAVSIAALLNSRRFHDYVLAKLQSTASESLGAQIQLQNFAVHLSPLGFDIYGVTVHGANP